MRHEQEHLLYAADSICKAIKAHNLQGFLAAIVTVTILQVHTRMNE